MGGGQAGAASSRSWLDDAAPTQALTSIGGGYPAIAACAAANRAIGTLNGEQLT